MIEVSAGLVTPEGHCALRTVSRANRHDRNVTRALQGRLELSCMNPHAAVHDKRLVLVDDVVDQGGPLRVRKERFGTWQHQRLERSSGQHPYAEVQAFLQLAGSAE